MTTMMPIASKMLSPPPAPGSKFKPLSLQNLPQGALRGWASEPTL